VLGENACCPARGGTHRCHASPGEPSGQIRDVGFVAITGHGISDVGLEVLESSQESWRKPTCPLDADSSPGPEGHRMSPPRAAAAAGSPRARSGRSRPCRRRTGRVDRALEIDGDLIPGAAARLTSVFSFAVTQPLDHRVDVALGDFRRDALRFPRLDGLQYDPRETLEGRDVGQVLAFAMLCGSIRGLPAGARWFW